MVRRTVLLNLAFSHRLHEWLLPPSGGYKASYGAFVSFCEKRGVAKVGFLRHGKTSPAPEGGVDFDRLLTDEGRKQATEAGESFGKEFKPFHESLLVSPAPRTMETAELFVASAQSKETVLKPLQGLYDGTMQPKGSQLFRKIGYAPLSAYLDSPDPEDRDLSRHLLGAYAETVIDSMVSTLENSVSSETAECLDLDTGDTTLWMVGHAIYLPAAALGVASIVDCNESGMNTILSCNTKEAEGYLIDLQNADATYLARPSQGS
mmetsp:Transcript_11749/g.18842  ORF Transcript_11749/g.18842 Transcript_11749/m.18842 type:complete len:263 (-) Transcript_11749:72-860(-)